VKRLSTGSHIVLCAAASVVMRGAVISQMQHLPKHNPVFGLTPFATGESAKAGETVKAGLRARNTSSAAA
jgi:hypothetical protein